jgi:peroxiredoxin/DNA-binding transcriptional MerR regulator
MRIGEAAHAAGITVRTLRYYERTGLLVPPRTDNGYRDYQSLDVCLAKEIRDLTNHGLAVAETRPFVECLRRGHARADACPESWAVYRREIDRLSRLIERLTLQRTLLAAYLDAAVGRTSANGGAALPRSMKVMVSQRRVDPLSTPDDTPDEISATRRLIDRPLPPLTLVSTQGDSVNLRMLGAGRTVLYCYPLTGRPGEDLPAGWDTIPGARGCTAEACNFRDHYQQLRAVGVQQVYGVSSQSSEYQHEVVARLHLPFAMLSDEQLALAEQMGLPTFSVEGQRLYKRLTLIVHDGVVERVYYPVTAPGHHAEEVVTWVRSHPRSRMMPPLRNRLR